MTDWPTHPNGENKRYAEMTDDEQKAVMAAARKRFDAAMAAHRRTEDENAAYRRDMIDAGRGYLLR